MKLTSGCSVADMIRNRPFPDPISSTTGLSFPNSFARSSRTNPVSRGLIATSAMKDPPAEGQRALCRRQLVHRDVAGIDHHVADAQRVGLLRFDELESLEM